jgi:hypothetical protein
MDHTGCQRLVSSTKRPAEGYSGYSHPGGVRLVTRPVLAVINWCVDCSRIKNCRQCLANPTIFVDEKLLRANLEDAEDHRRSAVGAARVVGGDVKPLLVLLLRSEAL